MILNPLNSSWLRIINFEGRQLQDDICLRSERQYLYNYHLQLSMKSYICHAFAGVFQGVCCSLTKAAAHQSRGPEST